MTSTNITRVGLGNIENSALQLLQQSIAIIAAILQ